MIRDWDVLTLGGDICLRLGRFDFRAFWLQVILPYYHAITNAMSLLCLKLT